MTLTIGYSAEGTAWGGRRGRVVSSDNKLDLQLSMPKELGGDGGEGTNPEQLFAIGYAACFHSALKAMARADHLDAEESAVTVTIGLGKDEETGKSSLAATIVAEMPGIEYSVALGLVERAHELCPYSNATRGNIPVTLDVIKS